MLVIIYCDFPNLEPRFSVFSWYFIISFGAFGAVTATRTTSASVSLDKQGRHRVSHWAQKDPGELLSTPSSSPRGATPTHGDSWGSARRTPPHLQTTGSVRLFIVSVRGDEFLTCPRQVTSSGQDWVVVLRVVHVVLRVV